MSPSLPDTSWMQRSRSYETWYRGPTGFPLSHLQRPHVRQTRDRRACLGTITSVQPKLGMYTFLQLTSDQASTVVYKPGGQ